MPPEVEGDSPVHVNGNAPKDGANGHIVDLMAANDEAVGFEGSGKSNGTVDLENCSDHQGEQEVPEASGSDAKKETSHVPVDQVEENSSSLETSEDSVGSTKPANDLSNGDAGNSVLGADHSLPSSEWTAPAGTSGWEAVGDVGVLGPGPSQEKTAESKATAAPERFCQFWMVRIPRPVDNKGKAEIRMAELRVKEKTEKRDFINAALQMKRASRNDALEKLRGAREKARACGDAVRSKRDEIDPLMKASKKIRDAGKLAREKGRDLPANEQELDQRIAYLEYRIEHESIPLKEEKLLLREIKSLKGSREEVCANAALHAEFQESLAERDEIQERLKKLMAELEILKHEWTAASERVKAADQEFEKIDSAVNQVNAQWQEANRARQETFEERSRLVRRDVGRNDEYYQNRREIHAVRQLAINKDKKGVEEGCQAQMERILTLWNNNPEYRANYVKSNERSTVKRLGTFDGRSLGPDEEPPLILGDEENGVEYRTNARFNSPQTSEKDIFVKSSVDSSNFKDLGSNLISDLRKKEVEREEGGSSFVANGNGFASKAKPIAVPVLDAVTEKKVETDLAMAAAEAKEKRRQQEMAKAKEAEERKKRVAERSQSKALARAQKEAEKKEREKVKRARKKAAAAAAGTHVSLGTRSLEESGSEIQEEPEIGPEAAVEETVSESKPKQRRRTGAIQQASARPVKPPSVPSSVIKKDVAVYKQTWFLILMGMLLIFGLIASTARYVS